MKKRDKGEKGFGNRSIRRDCWVLTGREEVEKVGREGVGAVTVGGIKRGWWGYKERIKSRRQQMRIWNFKERANLMWQVMGMPKKVLYVLALIYNNIIDYR